MKGDIVWISTTDVRPGDVLTWTEFEFCLVVALGVDSGRQPIVWYVNKLGQCRNITLRWNGGVKRVVSQ